jgi:hypothetical protein
VPNHLVVPRLRGLLNNPQNGVRRQRYFLVLRVPRRILRASNSSCLGGLFGDGHAACFYAEWLALTSFVTIFAFEVCATARKIYW